MSRQADGIEALLRQALAPVDPPHGLDDRLEEAFGSLVIAAAEELDAWELSAMRDPRNWLRPVGAVLVGSAAATGLVVIRMRRRRRRRRAAPARVLAGRAGRTAADLGRGARRASEAVKRR